jgi:YHS domain-containing protein
MTVDIANATAAALTSEHGSQSYYFCGRGCKLDFEDDPSRYLDSNYRPSM